jgi:hypothetical protein
MPKDYIVQAGETLMSIATAAGFRTIKSICDHPANAELLKTRPDPNLVCPGDKLVLPDLVTKELECATGQEHTFRVKGSPTYFRTVLKDDDGRACKETKFKLEFGGRTVEGTTKEDGVIEQVIPADTKEVKVTAWIDDRDGKDGFTWLVKLNSYEPIGSVRGLQIRLNNLGFDCGPITGEMNDETQDAIEAFKDFFELDTTEEGATKEVLRLLAELHDK